MTAIGFLVAAAIGAPARLLVDRYVQRRHPGRFPWGTFVVNATGCFLLGILTGLGLYHGLSPDVRTAVGTGGLGAYTTFSTFTVDTVQLLDEGAHEAALRVVVGSIVVGLTAAALGIAIVGAL